MKYQSSAFLWSVNPESGYLPGVGLVVLLPGTVGDIPADPEGPLDVLRPLGPDCCWKNIILIALMVYTWYFAFAMSMLANRRLETSYKTLASRLTNLASLLTDTMKLNRPLSKFSVYKRLLQTR